MYVSSKKGTALEEHNDGIVDAGSCGMSQERGRRRAWQRRALDMQIMDTGTTLYFPRDAMILFLVGCSGRTTLSCTAAAVGGGMAYAYIT